MKILVTGSAGFIGASLAYRLAERGDEVIGIDNINDYYDVRLKYARLRECGIVPAGKEFEFGNEIVSDRFANLSFRRIGLEDKAAVDALYSNQRFDVVVNLAAQAGVRYSIENPYAYLHCNVEGFLNVLEACRHNGVKKLVFASSSSVYGLNSQVPYGEDDKCDTPVSLYAATKKSDELMAHCYSMLYGIQCIGLRYFTVYGPWGRPDMSPMLFAEAIRKGESIKVYNNGDMARDFTYIDDIVEGTVRAVDYVLQAETCHNNVPYKVYNIGCGHPVKLMDFIAEMEQAFGMSVQKQLMPMQPGDVYQTHADTSSLQNDMGYCPKWSLHEGIIEFAQWYNSEANPLK